MTARATPSLLLLPIVLWACGEDETPQLSETEVEAVSGFYLIDAFEGSEEGCGPAEDRRDLLMDDRLAVVPQSFFNIRQVTVTSCQGAPGCEERAAGLQSSSVGPVALGSFVVVVSQSDGDILRGEGASTGFLIDGRCEMASVTTTSLQRQGDQLAIEHREYAVDAFAPEDGFCFTSGAQASGRGACQLFRRVRATFERPLP